MKQIITYAILLALVFCFACTKEVSTKKSGSDLAQRQPTKQEQEVVEKVRWVDDTLNNAPAPLLPCLHSYMQKFPKWHEEGSAREQFLPRKEALKVRWTAMALYAQYLTD